MYHPDSSLIETGESHSILEKYHENIRMKQHQSLRSFPEGNRNCYRIDVTSNTTYLIRAIFMYGNYDGKDSPPEFDLHLGPNLWDSVMFQDSSSFVYKEIIHVPLRNYIHICLVKKDSGIPFISAIDLRPLNGVPYQTQLGPLALYRRYDIGTPSSRTVCRWVMETIFIFILFFQIKKKKKRKKLVIMSFWIILVWTKGVNDTCVLKNVFAYYQLVHLERL